MEVRMWEKKRKEVRKDAKQRDAFPCWPLIPVIHSRKLKLVCLKTDFSRGAQEKPQLRADL